MVNKRKDLRLIFRNQPFVWG